MTWSGRRAYFDCTHAPIKGVMRVISEPGQGAQVLSCPLCGLSRILDDDGPFSASGNREIPGKRSPPRSPAKLDHRECGRSALWHGFLGAIWHPAEAPRAVARRLPLGMLRHAVPRRLLANSPGAG